MNHRLLRLLTAGAIGGSLCAQSFTDLTESRNSPAPFPKLFQLEAGAIATKPQDKQPAFGLDDEITWDARAYYRNEEFTSRKATLEAYAGRDGVFGSFSDGKLIGDQTVTRIEVRGRPWMYYRDGFYRDGHLIPNGFFEGSDWEGYAGFGKEAQGLYVEIGPYYRALDFKRSNLTPVTYTIPDGFAAYGGRLYLEQSTVQMDRRRGLPRSGYVFTLCGEREWNDSSSTFGTAAFSTELPSSVWRARGRLEWYVPSSDSTLWEVWASGAWSDDKDRLQNSEGQRPLGSLWVDAQVRLRVHLGTQFTFTPFFEGQYSKTLEEDGFGSNKDFFFGGGAEIWLHLSDPLSIHAWYSFLDNENRPSVSIDEDLHGEHMAYIGMVLRLGATRR